MEQGFRVFKHNMLKHLHPQCAQGLNNLNGDMGSSLNQGPFLGPRYSTAPL